MQAAGEDPEMWEDFVRTVPAACVTYPNGSSLQLNTNEFQNHWKWALRCPLYDKRRIMQVHR